MSALAGLGVLLAAGCGVERAAAPPDAAGLSEAEALLVGREVAGEVADLAGTLTIGSLLVPEFPSGGIAASAPDEPRPTTVCPTITPFPPTDADGDRVPDDVTLSFTLPACSFGRDGRTLEITGTIRITDPSTTEVGARAAFTDFQHRVIGAGGAFFLTRLNGVRQALFSGSGFSLVDSTTTDREASGRDAAQLVKGWVVSFVADPGQAVDHLRGLPSGDLTVDGSLTRSRGTETHSFAVETVTPLHYDATCPLHPKFTSGELVVTKSWPTGMITIRIVFTGCGEEPTVTVERSTT